MNKIELFLNYTFRTPELLELALKPRSNSLSVNNERLEYLGDAFLTLSVSEYLYEMHPSSNEGELTRMRSTLVRRESLYDYALLLQLDKHVQMSLAEKKLNKMRQQSIIADSFEAVFGALFLDAGYIHAKKIFITIFGSLMSEKITKKELKDPKTILQEYAQSKEFGLPVYETVDIQGPAHQPVFYVKCLLIEHQTQGHGYSKKEAQLNAAAKMMALIGNAE